MQLYMKSYSRSLFNNQVTSAGETTADNFDCYHNNDLLPLKWNKFYNQNSQFTVTNILENFYSLYTINTNILYSHV